MRLHRDNGQQHILVVCLGNTCRSPMAAAVLSRLLGDHAVVESAGLETCDGLSAAKNAVAAMRELGIDIRDHQSRNIHNINLASYDRIVAMTPSIARHLNEMIGSAPAVVTLDVDDPYGGAVDVYRDTVKKIALQLQPLVADFVGKQCDR